MVTITNAKRLPDGIAPLWHTVVLAFLIVLVAVAGTLAKPSIAPSARISAMYVPAILVQCGLVYWVSRAFRPRSVLRDLVGRARPGDVGIALALGMFVVAFELAFAAPNPQALAILPRTGLERAIWLVLALCVGFAEELVYRGYFIRQFRSFTNGATAAIVLSALLFAIAHANQGAFAMLRFGLYAVAFGAIAVWRRSLVPTILCHVTLDAMGAFH